MNNYYEEKSWIIPFDKVAYVNIVTRTINNNTHFRNSTEEVLEIHMDNGETILFKHYDRFISEYKQWLYRKQ